MTTKRESKRERKAKGKAEAKTDTTITAPEVTVNPDSPWATERDLPPTINTGRYTGLHVMQFQNWLFKANADMRLTDYQLAILWAVEFPRAKCNFMAKTHYVGSTRTLFNKGKHANPGNTFTSVPYGRTQEEVKFSVHTPLVPTTATTPTN